MTEIHKIKCDCCGKESKMQNSDWNPVIKISPVTWYHDSDLDQDYCSKCWKCIKAKRKEAVNQCRVRKVK